MRDNIWANSKVIVLFFYVTISFLKAQGLNVMCDVINSAIEVVRPAIIASDRCGRCAAHAPLDSPKTICQDPALSDPNVLQESLKDSHILIGNKGSHAWSHGRGNT